MALTEAPAPPPLRSWGLKTVTHFDPTGLSEIGLSHSLSGQIGKLRPRGGRDVRTGLESGLCHLLSG